MTTPAEAMRELIERCDAHDFDAITRTCHPDVEWTSAFGTVRGAEAYRAFAEQLYRAIPDARHHLWDLIEHDDVVAYQVEIIGTFSGPLSSPTGTVQPTGAPVVMAGADFVHFRDGRIATWRTYVDPASLTALGMG